MERVIEMTSLLPALTFAAALGSGIMAGFFYSFSNVIMGSLARIPAPVGIAAMQSINIVVQNPVFFLLFFGTALLSLILIAMAAMGYATGGTGVLVAGGVVYLVAVIGVTIFFNVPMNNALAATDPASAAGAESWADYLRRWTMWNHVRTVGNVAALALFLLALMRQA